MKTNILCQIDLGDAFRHDIDKVITVFLERKEWIKKNGAAMDAEWQVFPFPLRKSSSSYWFVLDLPTLNVFNRQRAKDSSFRVLYT